MIIVDGREYIILAGWHGGVGWAYRDDDGDRPTPRAPDQEFVKIFSFPSCIKTLNKMATTT